MIQPPRLVTSEQADRWFIRGAIQHDVARVATAVWWGAYTIEEAAEEIRGMAYMQAKRHSVAPAIADAVAIAALDEEMQRQEAAHTESLAVMAEAALLAIREGASRAQARATVAEIAKQRPVPPTPHILTAAIDRAAEEHRRTEAFWKKREPAE